MPKFRTLLKNRDFVLYSIGQAFSQFGDRLVQIILIGFVYKKWPGSTFQLAKLLCFTVIPSFLISPIAGVYVDRWRRKHVLIISDMLRALLIFLIPVFFLYGDKLVPIYGIIFLVFASACFFLPARLSIIPSLVPNEELLLANSASSITWVVAGIAGFSFGGIIAELIGVRNSLYINSFVYSLSAFSFLGLAFSMRNRNSKHHAPARAEKFKYILKKSFLYDFKEGLQILFKNKKIKPIFFIFLTLSALIGTLYVVLLVFIQETLQSMTKHIGLFGLYLFFGILVGAYIYGRTGNRYSRKNTVILSLFLIGTCLSIFVVGLRITGSFWLGAITSFLTGFFVSPLYAISNTIIHESIESKARGRIFSLLGIVINAGFLLFMFISSILAEYVDRMWILLACGSILMLVGIVGILVGIFKKLTFSSSISS